MERAGSAHGEVYVLSDFQKYTWMRNSDEISQTARLVADLGERHTLYFVDCAGEVEYNDAMMRLAPADPIMSPITTTTGDVAVAAMTNPTAANR